MPISSLSAFTPVAPSSLFPELPVASFSEAVAPAPAAAPGTPSPPTLSPSCSPRLAPRAVISRGAQDPLSALRARYPNQPPPSQPSSSQLALDAAGSHFPPQPLSTAFADASEPATPMSTAAATAAAAAGYRLGAATRLSLAIAHAQATEAAQVRVHGLRYLKRLSSLKCTARYLHYILFSFCYTH